VNPPDSAGAPLTRRSPTGPGKVVSARASRAGLLALGVAVLAAIHLAVALRGTLANDAKMQWAQIAAGRLNDWHPPAMARLWQALGLFGPGPAPFIWFSVLLYWSGFLVLGLVLLRERRPGAALATLGLGVGAAALWFEAISKDTLLTSFFLLGFALALLARQSGRPRTGLLAAAAALFLVGVLMRHNGAFAAGPAMLLACAPQVLRRFWLATGVSVAVAALLVPLSQFADHRLFGAAPSRVENTLLLFDLAGIAYHADDASVFGKPAITARVVKTCYSPVMWDTMAPWGICPWFPAAAGARLLDQPELIAGGIAPPANLMGKWLSAVIHHPLAYAEHRLRHANAEMLLLVSTKPRNGVVPADPAPAPADSLLLTIARYTAGVVFIPGMVVAIGLAAFLLLSARVHAAEPAPSLILGAYAMSGSALLYAASYAVLGVATAPRYYMLTGVLSLAALIVAIGDAEVGRIWRRRGALRIACLALPLSAVALAEVGRLCIPVPPSRPLIAAP